MDKITPCLWFDTEGEDAAKFYTSVFPNSWQIVPRRLTELLADPDREKSQRVMAAMLKMGKIQIDELEQAAAAA